jgi:hypothetical protein
MNAFYDWIFFFVFFLPMGVLVAMNLLLHRDFPDIAAAWARLTRIECATRGRPGRRRRLAWRHENRPSRPAPPRRAQAARGGGQPSPRAPPAPARPAHALQLAALPSVPIGDRPVAVR